MTSQKFKSKCVDNKTRYQAWVNASMPHMKKMHGIFTDHQLSCFLFETDQEWTSEIINTGTTDFFDRTGNRIARCVYNNKGVIAVFINE